MTEKTVHEGRNVKRIREILGVKQDALAIELGISQQAISALEQKEALDRDMLDKIAKALKVPVEAFKNFDEEKAINIIGSTFNDSAIANTFNDSTQANFHCTFNPLDKLLEQVEENKKLYQSLLKEKDEKIKLLEKLLDK